MHAVRSLHSDAPVKIVCPEDMIVNLKFKHGKVEIQMDISFKEGEMVEETLERIMEKEGIPFTTTLSISLLSTIHALFEECELEMCKERHSTIVPTSEAVESALAWAESFASTHLRWSELSALAKESGEDKDPSVASRAPNDILDHTYHHEADEFVSAYRYLMGHSERTRRNIMQMEINYAMALKDELNARDGNVSDLRRAQEEEMTRMYNTDPEASLKEPTIAVLSDTRQSDLVEDLVAKQVKELEIVEKQWKDEISSVKRMQKEDFKEFILSLYASVKDEEAAKSEATVSDHENSPMRSLNNNNTQSPQTADEKSPTSFREMLLSTPKSTKEVASWLGSQLTTPRRSLTSLLNRAESAPTTPSNRPTPVSPPNTVSTMSSSNPAPKVEKSKSDGQSSSSNNTAGTKSQSGSARKLSKESWKRSESFILRTGAQLKTSYEIRLVMGEYVQSLAPPSSVEERETVATRLYSDSLSATTFLVPDLSFSSSHMRDFRNLCESSTDLHFPQLSEQLGEPSLEEGDPVEGDIVITKHSNLKSHLVLYLMTSRNDLSFKSTLLPNSALVNSIKRLLSFAHKFDVGDLTIPALLVHSSRDITTKEADVRIEKLAKAIKSFLFHCSRDSSLRRIQLVVPNEDRLFDVAKNVMTRIVG